MREATADGISCLQLLKPDFACGTGYDYYKPLAAALTCRPHFKLHNHQPELRGKKSHLFLLRVEFSRSGKGGAHEAIKDAQFMYAGYLDSSKMKLAAKLKRGGVTIYEDAAEASNLLKMAPIVLSARISQQAAARNEAPDSGL